MSKNYYKILGIEKNSTEKEIKKAYAVLIRKYPPEKFADEFNEIRQAYEVLSNAELRREYDEKNGFSDIAQELFDTALDNIDKDEYELAIRDLKKFIMLEPEVISAKNYLFICYYRLDRYEEAYNIQKEVVKSNDNLKEVYFTNFYEVCIELEKYKEAEECMNNALKIFDTYEVNIKLVNLYVQRNYLNKDKARDILKNKIDTMVNESNLDYFDYIVVAYYTGLVNELELEKKFLGYLIERTDKQGFQEVLTDIMRYADIWVSGWWFENALIHIEAIINLGRKFNENNDKDMNEFIEAMEYVHNITSEVNKIYTGEMIDAKLLGFIVNKLRNLLDMRNGEEEKLFDEEREKEAKELALEIETIIKTNPQSIKDSIDHIKKKYTLLYDEVKEEIEIFYSKASEKLEKFESKTNNSNNSQNSNYNKNVGTDSNANYGTSAKEANSINNSNSSNSSSEKSGGGNTGKIILCGIVGAYFGGPFGFFIGCIIGGFIFSK